MLSQTEYLYIKDLVIQMYNNDYKDYVCVTNNPDNYINNNVYDVICRFSKEDIQVNNNRFIFNTDDNLICSFDSNNYSDNNTIDKLVCESFTNGQVNLSTKEYVYSNVGNYSNLIGNYETSLNNHLSLNSFYLIPALIMILILIRFISSCFRRSS